jgi:NADPH:quinone reductase-like Zn-dependent oxidoreductase
MKAIVQDRYGSPDVLELRDIEKPKISDDEVLVRVRAAGVDRGVWHLMTGLPYFLRLIIPDLGRKAPKNPVRGSDVAGVVEAVGKDAGGFKPGDEVFGIGMGSYAEYAVVSKDKLAPKPANLTFEEASVVPISGLTALQAVRDSGKVKWARTFWSSAHLVELEPSPSRLPSRSERSLLACAARRKWISSDHLGQTMSSTTLVRTSRTGSIATT